MLSSSFVPRESAGKPFGLLVLVMRSSIVVLGVPDGVSRGELVELFRRHGVQEAQSRNP